MTELIRLAGYTLFAGGLLCVGYTVFEVLLRLIFPDDY